MAKEVKLIYQDCPMCGARENWGKRQTEVANKHGLKIVEVPFSSPGASDIIVEAILGDTKFITGDKTMPFFTDGEKYSKELADFLPAKKKVNKKTTKSEHKAHRKEETK